jgi:hypothetical protein
MRYDKIALSLAIVSLPLTCLGTITALVAIFFAIRSFKAPAAVVGSTKGRSVVALVLAGVQLIGWGIFAIFRIRSDFHG